MKEVNNKTVKFKITSRDKKILSLAVIILIIKYIFVAPAGATIEYHFLSLLLPIISYSAIIIILSSLIAIMMRKFKTLTAPIFTWLLLFAAIFDLGVAIYRIIMINKINALLGI